MFGKILAFLKEILPRASRVTVLIEGPRRPSGAFEDTAQRMGFTVNSSFVKDLNEAEQTMAAISRQGTDAVYLPLLGFTF